MNYSLYCSNDLTNLAGGEQEAQYGPPACIGLEFAATDDLILEKTGLLESRYRHPIERFLRDGVCPRGTKLRIRLAHPTSNTDRNILKETPGMHHLVELSINGTAISFQKPHNPDGNNADPSGYNLFQTFAQSVATEEAELRQLVARRIQQLVQEFFKGYFHISAVRSLPEKAAYITSRPPNDGHARRSVGGDGREAPNVFIWNCHESLNFEGLEKYVQAALHDLLDISLHGPFEQHGLNRFTNAYLSGPQFPEQMSSGFHQLFPIIVQLGAMFPGDLLSVENPEVHLHPDLQLKVSEFLLKQSRNGRRIMIETHSDLIIRRVLRAILAEEDGLSQQHVSLNFSTAKKDESGTGSVLRQFGVDARGHIEWPEGFMDASITESQRLMDVMYGNRSSRTNDAEEE
jgi:hypothetical protein